jgi:hypothetical protein
MGIGSVDTKIGHSSYGTVRPRVISECGNMNNPRPLAYEACLKKTCADSASLDAMESASWHREPSNQKKIRNSVSTSPGTDQFTRLGSRLVLCTAGLASVRSTISRYGVVARASKRSHPLRNLSLRAGVTEQSKAGKSARAHPLLRLVWQYMSIISPVYTYTF